VSAPAPPRYLGAHVKRLEDPRLLTGGGRALPRHQTLQATMHWSYDHLSAAEKAKAWSLRAGKSRFGARP